MTVSIRQGTRLGRYEIGSRLGAGAMGEVYRAHDLTLNRTVAIKFLLGDVTANGDRLRRFEREALAASSLNHPNILTIFEIGHENEYHFIATEFIDGESLGQRLSHGPLKVNESLDVAIQIASALSAAHEAGIIHRDIKPDNIMLRRDALVKVLDFGLAKLLNEQDHSEDTTQVMDLTIPGMVMGTARYMSPEQARGLPLDARTDVWSLGVVLYQMISGESPFTGKTMSDIIVAVLKTEPPLLSKQLFDLPDELERIVMKALQKEKEQRHRSAKELERDLKRLKRRLEFEAELKRSNTVEGRGTAGPASVDPQAGFITTVSTRNEVANLSGTSSAEYPVNTLRRNKGGALLLLAILVALTIGGAYLGYTRYAGGRKADITSLAVLPFVNTSSDPEKEYLSDGISESLINRLSQIPGMKVIANSSSLRYKGRDVDPQAVATALDVGAVVTGKVTEHGNKLTINVELINGHDRTQLWGEQYDRQATDLIQVQSEISRKIAETLRLRMTAGQQELLAKHDPVNPEAYESLLKGRFYRAKGSTEDRRKAAEFFSQAITIDPAYAPAYADLSDIYRSLANSSLVDPREYLPRARAAAEKALESDDTLAEAHYAVANLQTYAWEWEKAEREYKRAIELNPNLALAHRWYASYLRLVGQHEKAIAEIKRARELDPLSPGVNATVGLILLSARQYDQALDVLKQTLELDPDYPYTHLFLGLTYAAKGKHSEAIAAYQKAIKLGLDSPSTKINLAAAYARAGDLKRVEEILSQLDDGKQYISPGEVALIYVGLGQRDKAFALLEKAYEIHDPQLQYLSASPGFDPLRSDPRFEELMRRVGLTH